MPTFGPVFRKILRSKLGILLSEHHFCPPIQDLNKLSEIIIVVYGVEQKALLTGAISEIKSDNLKDLPVATLDGMLQGQAAGVQVTQNSGTPGAALSVRIRGVSSIGGV